MIPYASRTGSRKQLEYAWSNGWRLLVSSEGVMRHEGMPYAMDNGAWHSHQQRKEWSSAKFYQLCNKLGRGADWIASPDIVCGGSASLAKSVQWLPYVLRFAPALIPVQDGMEPEDIAHLFGDGVGVFVGGSTEWKMHSIPAWCQLGRERKCIVHVGRVNSAKRIEYCAVNGATSFDGSGPSRYVKEMERLDGAVARSLTPRTA